jgi:DNA-binding CsgD family transcriptional regulator/tetratricopeptide (TPR) repeat protein
MSAARNGRGGALVLRGDPGIGKTALLDAATRDVPGVRVVRSDGYEAESAMPYAALQRIGTPFAAHLPALPPRQVAALRIAAGLDEGSPPDRYLIGLGMLSLLAVAGEDEPLVCVIDDAHLIDPESLEVLTFVARRLQAESIAILFGIRPDARVQVAAAGVPTLELGGLAQLDATHLLNRSARTSVDPFLASRIATETGGNPLALIDLGREYTARQLSDSSIAPAPVPVGQRLEIHYLGQLEQVPHDAQVWLRVAAAESTGDATLIAGAAARLDLPTDAASGAERAGLAVVRDTVEFRHPLARAAVYNGMPATERRRVHGALRDVADELGRADLAVWHAAAATVGTDAAVAERMEQAADAAGGRGGTASRARLLARAADLTPDGPAREGRLLAAAEAAAGAGAAQLALDLLDRLDAEHLDPVSLGRMLSLQATLATFTADAAGILSGTATMLRAAGLFHGLVPELEQRTLLRAFDLALNAEWAMAGATLPGLGERLAIGATAVDGPLSIALDALAAHILLPYEQAVPKMRAALTMLGESDDASLLEAGTYGIALSMALWDERACIELLERTARAARDAGALRMLDTTLWLLSLIEVVRGDPVASGRYVEQVRELRRAIGYDAEQVVNASYLAWAGAEPALVEAIAQAALDVGFGGAWTIAMTGLSVRSIAEGHYRDAFERLQPMIERPFLQVTYQQLPDYVEAGVRSGNPDEARAASDQLARFAAASGTPWIRGVAERCAALLAHDDHAEAHYRQAIEHLEQSTAPGDLGRAHLVYGEWLRRAKRRREAREQLRLALEIFARVGAPAFADRARRELESTGEHVSRHASGSADELTPQEGTIARLAASGHTNAEIGATLFISVNTVDYHLRKVFRKLEVSSRRQLSDRFPAD